MSDAPRSAADLPVEDVDDLFENAPVGLLSLRQDGGIVRANATFAEWIGRTQVDLMTLRFQDLLTVGTRIFYETNAAPLLRMQGHFTEVALELRTAQGEVLPVFVHATSRPAGNAREPAVRIALSTALNRRRYEGEIVEARARATAAEAATKALLEVERETSE